ncbi:MAG: hypothetical protein NTX05_00535 [Fusobacteria bacterium]|nr:hypothetical protein [Fusobacteriota bacterium]
MKTKIKVLIIFCISIFLFGCANMQVNDNSKTIAVIDSQLLSEYNSWDIVAAKSRLNVLENNGSISQSQAENILAMLSQREILKENFVPFVELMKQHIGENDVNYIKSHTYPTLINSMMVGQLGHYNLSQASFYYGKVTFANQFSKFILIINYADQSEYLEVTLIAANNQWWIYDVKELH